MNALVKKILEDYIWKKKADLPMKVAINAIHYYMGVAASLRRVSLSDNDGHTIVPINYIGITLSKSGSGKSLAAGLARYLILDVEEKFSAICLTKLKKLIEAGDGHMPLVEYKDGSMSGFLADRAALDAAGIGSSNIHVEELLDVLKGGEFDQVLNMLIESWQEGKSSARKFKSYTSPSIGYVPSNALLYGSPEGFRSGSDNRFKAFEDTLANGLARRSYVVFDETEQSFEEEPTYESIMQEKENLRESKIIGEELREYISSILLGTGHDNIVITISAQAELELRKYEISLKNKVSVNPLIKNAVRAEMLSRAYKIRRLAAMYALYDGGNEVSCENVADAIEWAESLNKDLSIVLNAETPQERIYDFLSKVNKYVSATEITKYCGITTKEFREVEPEIYSVAYDAGSVVQKKVFDDEAKVIKYNLIRGKATEPDKMICSASDDMGHGYEVKQVGFRQIPDLLLGSHGIHYSAGTYVNQHRTKENYIRKANLIIFDIDEGTSIEDAKIFLKDYKGYISTTRNHQREKVMGSGKIKPACDRYRVILVSKFEFNLSPDDFKETLKNIAEFIGLEVDNAAIEVARMYYSNPQSEIIPLLGDELVDIRQFVPQTKEVEKTREAINRYEKDNNVNAFDKHFLRKATVGSRNNELFKLGAALMDHKGASLAQAQAKILEINSMLSDPLDDNEIERTIFKSLQCKS